MARARGVGRGIAEEVQGSSPIYELHGVIYRGGMIFQAGLERRKHRRDINRDTRARSIPKC